jgi:hypothetical protein
MLLREEFKAQSKKRRINVLKGPPIREVARLRFIASQVEEITAYGILMGSQINIIDMETYTLNLEKQEQCLPHRQ